MPVVTRTAGDCHARFEVLLDQVYVSLDLAEQCLHRVDQITGPVNVRLPKVVKAPEGHTYAWTENPLGINGYYLVSRGDKTPWRMKLRTASYANVQALSTLLPGCTGARPDRDPRARCSSSSATSTSSASSEERRERVARRLARGQATRQ